MYTHTHIHVTEKEIYPVTLVSTTTLTFHDTLPLLEKRNHIFKIRFPPDSTWRKERKFRKGKKKGEGRFYRIIVRSYPFFHARWIRRDSAIPWTNGEFSTRGWKRRVNRTRYFVAWNNNEAGWPQCVCNGCSVISRLPGIHLPPSLSLFSTVLSSSRLSALHENRENPEAWFAFCIDGNRRPIPASRFVFRPKRAARGVPGSSRVGIRIEIYFFVEHYKCFSKAVISVKIRLGAMLRKLWQSWKCWVYYYYLFFLFSSKVKSSFERWKSNFLNIFFLKSLRKHLVLCKDLVKR